MAQKGYWVARCAHLDGIVCRCPENEKRPGRSLSYATLDAAAAARAASLEPKNPEFTLQQLKEQISEPVVTIDTTQPLPRFKLNGIHTKIIQKARREATEFVQGKRPILPQKNSLACIALRGIHKPPERWATVKVCFEMRSFYVKGVLVGENFFEVRKSDDDTRLVEGSIALECGVTYLELFGRDKPNVQLSDYALLKAFGIFTSLAPGVARSLLSAAAASIGMVSLILIEPSRQCDVMKKLYTGDPSSRVYYTMDPYCWEIVNMWDARSKVAKGIDYDDEKIEEKHTPHRRSEAIAQLNVVNSTKNLPVKQIGHTHVLNRTDERK